MPEWCVLGLCLVPSLLTVVCGSTPATHRMTWLALSPTIAGQIPPAML